MEKNSLYIFSLIEKLDDISKAKTIYILQFWGFILAEGSAGIFCLIGAP